MGKASDVQRAIDQLEAEKAVLQHAIDKRFWLKVQKDGPVPAHQSQLGPCWIWLAAKDSKGYGRTGVGKKSKLSTHVSWFLSTNEWPELLVLHKCDNPPCVNPSHLFLGTHADNAQDARVKGRLVGKRQRLLTPEQVEQLRRIPGRLKKGQLAALASEFGVSEGCIRASRDGHTWKWLNGDQLKERQPRAAKQLFCDINNARISLRRIADHLAINSGTLWGLFVKAGVITAPARD
jgi:hypothetical protein